MTKLLGLTGHGTRNGQFVTTARVGKDEVAKVLNMIGFNSYSFATPVKQSAQILFGLTDKEAWDDEWKIKQIHGWNLTGRQFMQRHGTDAIRNIFNENIWVDKIEHLHNKKNSDLIGNKGIFADPPKSDDDVLNEVKKALSIVFDLPLSLYGSADVDKIVDKFINEALPEYFKLPSQEAKELFFKIRKTKPTVINAFSGPLVTSLNTDKWTVLDVRFENEASKIRDLGGKILHIKREIPLDIHLEINHSSEKGVQIQKGDLILSNDGNLEDLNKKVISMMDMYEGIVYGN